MHIEPNEPETAREYWQSLLVEINSLGGLAALDHRDGPEIYSRLVAAIVEDPDSDPGISDDQMHAILAMAEVTQERMLADVSPVASLAHLGGGQVYKCRIMAGVEFS